MKRKFVTLAVIFGYMAVIQAVSKNVDYYDLGNKHYLNAKNDSALICVDLALAHQADTADYARKVETLLLRSRVMGSLTFFQPALESAIQSYDISDKHGLENLKALSLLSIGKVHYMMYNDSIAEDYMLQAKKLALQKKFDKELMMIDNSLSQLYSVLERNDECVALATNSLEMAKQQKDTLYIIQNLTLMAAYYTNLNSRTDPINPVHQVKVKQYLDEALQIASVKKIPLLIMGVYSNFVRYYRVEKNYPEALNYANKVIEMCDKTNYSLLIQMYDHLVGIYAHMGNAKMAIDSHQQFHVLMRRQSDYNLHQSLQEMRVKYDVQGKELEIAQQQAKIKQARLHRLVLIIATLSALLLSGTYYYMNRLRRKQNKRLYQLNNTKNKLFSIISHDLKSPVAAQRLAVENILANFDNFDAGQLQKSLNDFHQATESQLDLLQNLLSWARMQTGEMKFNPIPFDISEMIAEVLELFKLPAQNKGIKFNIDVEKNCVAVADRQMIHTVLRNLVNNAIKFSYDNSEIYVHAACKDNRTTISIKDNGVGINAENINTLLELGNNKSTNGTKGETGSGLGLIITKELLEKNGSELIISSEAGKGTEVRFELEV